MKLPRDHYVEQDALQAARSLLGKVLCSNFRGGRVAAMITETEAYLGIHDRASHAYGGRRTARNEMMYATGGMAYVYLCYGIHHLFNVVVHEKDEPHAVLIRALFPLEGRTLMVRRRGGRETWSGPGSSSQGMGITASHNGTDLCGDRIWIEDRGISVPDNAIITGPRIGVDYAGADALLPYRHRFTPSHGS